MRPPPPFFSFTPQTAWPHVRQLLWLCEASVSPSVLVSSCVSCDKASPPGGPVVLLRPYKPQDEWGCEVLVSAQTHHLRSPQGPLLWLPPVLLCSLLTILWCETFVTWQQFATSLYVFFFFFWGFSYLKEGCRFSLGHKYTAVVELDYFGKGDFIFLWSGKSWIKDESWVSSIAALVLVLNNNKGWITSIFCRCHSDLTVFFTKAQLLFFWFTNLYRWAS